jgi:hypothetical protein
MVESGHTFTSTVGKVGYRKRYYRRTRADGTPIDDVEWSMSHLERVAAPLLREVEQRWPLSDPEKAILAEFAALQVLRGPRFRAWQEKQREQAIEDMRGDEALTALSDEHGRPVGEQDVDRVAEHLRTDTQRLVDMLALISKIGSILGSMHWTLLRFESPLLATSDHPVHVWHLERSSSQPLPARMAAGMLKTLEVRLPLSPHVALLMSWLPRPDPDSPVAGARHHPRNINAFTVAEAEKQWFCLPDTNPPVGAGAFLPISGDLYPGYDTAAALNSPLRIEVDRATQPKIGADVRESTELEIIRVRAPGTKGATDKV